MTHYVKAYEHEYFSSNDGIKKLLEHYKDIFEHLSGLEINHEINHYIEEVLPEKLRQEQICLLRMRQATDRSIVNFISHKYKM